MPTHGAAPRLAGDRPAREPQYEIGGRMQYNLGLPQQGYGIDDDMLDIALDKAGRVTNVQIYSS